jgi:signal transduction histidine kinase
MKTRDIKKAARIIENEYGSENFSQTLENIAIENNLCIEITDKYGNSLYSFETLGGNSLIHRDYGARLFGWRNELIESEEGYFYYGINDERFDRKTLVYGEIIGESGEEVFVFLNSMLEPVDSTAAIIKEQLMYITIILLELSFIITMFISKKISRPIVRITKSAQKLAKGDYTAEFDGGDYQEAQQLAQVLTYAEKEISKVDSLRRELVSNISHDLRTPLTIIKAYAEMVRDLSGESKEKREKHLGVIIDEADRLAALVNGLLELSKFESGNIPLELSEFEITEKIEEVLKRYRIFEERDGYTFIYEKADAAVVRADTPKIEQVLYNFINNAVNYTGDDKIVRICQINKKDAVRIEIIDTGAGIEKEMLPLIFDRYYRDKKIEREVTGTGLGLSIVKEILRLHGFPFGVSSIPGKGSTFWFEIKKA